MKPTLLSYEIHIVLVKSLYALNIGSVSRAMSNMGAVQLHLIQPQCEITYDAQQMAANGQDGLAHRIVYTSWDEFISQNSEGIRIALTARDGRARTLHDLKSGLRFIGDLPEVNRASVNKLFLFFGPEDCGLSGEEIDYAHFACSLPTYGPNWSLNLAQAVLLALFIVRDTWGGERTTLDGQFRPRESRTEAMLKKSNILPSAVIHDWIETLGFDLSKRRINAYTVLKRILLHNVPSTKELRILDVVLQQTLRKLKEHKTLLANLSNREHDTNGAKTNPLEEVESLPGDLL
jgi:tRNA/rRNA methyltransferase